MQHVCEFIEMQNNMIRTFRLVELQVKLYLQTLRKVKFVELLTICNSIEMFSKHSIVSERDLYYIEKESDNLHKWNVAHSHFKMFTLFRLKN